MVAVGSAAAAAAAKAAEEAENAGPQKKEASNYATARQEYINFRRHTVLPIVKLIFSRMNHDSGFIKNFNN